jgi:hypothetical protein
MTTTTTTTTAVLILAATLLALPIQPTASAHDPELRYDFTHPGEVTGGSNGTLSQNQSQDLLTYHDDDSNDHLNATEAHDLEDHLARANDDSGTTTWDGEQASSYSLLTLNVTNAQGPITPDKQLHYHSTAKAAYPSTSNDDTHEFRRMTDTDDDGTQLTVSPPPGYEITNHRGLHNATQDGSWLTGTMTETENVGITFTPTQDDEEASQNTRSSSDADDSGEQAGDTTTRQDAGTEGTTNPDRDTSTIPAPSALVTIIVSSLLAAPGLRRS